MKEEYLQIDSSDQSINDMVKELTGQHYRPKPWKLYPAKSALLVLDMQNYFLDPASHAFTPSALAIVPNINKLIDFARKFKMQIIFTKHVNDAENAGMMGKWWRDNVKEGSYEAEIVKTVGREDGKTVRLYDNKIIVKHQYDAFYGTDLEDYLRLKDIEQVIICGVLTNLCCETTARSAFVRGFEVLFPIDATAAYNREFHLSTFRNLGFGFCPILTTDDLINSIDK
jgi:nicotinamidase-related amidase